jgi:CspA family cold shock protein
MSFKDALATCQQCGKRFVFTVTAQREMADKGLPIVAPEYCPACRELMPLTDDEGKGQGVVKWFNQEKGYGFIVLPSGEEIFVHKTGLADDVSTLKDGQTVQFEVEETIKGPQAVNVTPL